MRKHFLWPVLVVMVALIGVGLAAAYAPYVYEEYAIRFDPHQIVDPHPVKIARGRMVDDYWSVETVAPNTYAIGEPRYYQQNYSYLILGSRRAIMFDSGTGTRNIMPVIRSLTTLPVTVIPSHLHFDHTGGLAPFDDIALIDLLRLRAETHDGRFQPGRYEFLGAYDHLKEPTFRVSEWWAPGTVVDLGDRKIEVLSTPGHTPNGVSLHDARAKLLFTGDYIYPTTIYAFLPGASLSTYRATGRRLLETVPRDTILWTAHCCRHGEDAAAPWLTMRDLSDLMTALDRHQEGALKGKGFYPVRYPVSNQMTLATGFGWNNP